jgi:hypothetical protein
MSNVREEKSKGKKGMRWPVSSITIYDDSAKLAIIDSALNDLALSSMVAKENIKLIQSDHSDCIVTLSKD